MRTTNDRLGHVLAEIDLLITWAEADAQHASESDAPGVAKDDRRRAKTLRRARKLVEECRR